MIFSKESTHHTDQHNNTAHFRKIHAQKRVRAVPAAAAAAAREEAGDSAARYCGTAAVVVVSTAAAIRQEEHTYWHWLGKVMTTDSRFFI